MTAIAFRIALAVVGLVAAVAACVALLAAPEARQAIGASFGGVDPTFAAATGIFTENLRLATGGIAACALVRAPLVLAGWPIPARFLGRAGQGIGLLYMSVLLAINVLTIGALIGAYGSTGIRSLLPHAPIELTAFSLLGALFVRSLYPASLHAREVAVVLVGIVALLAASAGVELVSV